MGEREGGLGFVEVMMDSVLIEDLPIRYRVSFFFSLFFFCWDGFGRRGRGGWRGDGDGKANRKGTD